MSKDDGSALRFLITAIITVICLGISFYQVTIGYKDLVGSYWLSGLISLVIVLILFYLAYEIREQRRKNQSIVKYFIAYFVFVLFSFAGNFNAFYTQFMKGELLKAELVEKHDAFTKLREDAKIALESSTQDISPQINQLVGQLESQIKNPSEPGCGSKCEEVLVTLEGLLGTKITRLTSNDKNFLIQEYRKLVEDASKSKLELAKSTDKNRLIEQIDNDILIFKPQIDAAMQDPTNKALGLIGVMVDKYKDYGKKVKAFAGKLFNYDEQIKVNNAEIGRLNFTFSSAKENIENWGTWIAGFLSLFVDLFVPLFILLVTKPTDRDIFSGVGSKKNQPKII